MKTGASTSCLFPMLTEQSLSRLLGMGIKNIELFFNSPSERSAPFAKMIRERADGAGARIVSVHPYSSEMEGVGFFGVYPRRFDDEADDYRRYFEACGILGADIFVFHGARRFLPIERGFYFERFERLRRVAAEFGVTLCQENVARCHSGSPGFIREMARELPEARFVLDVKQSVRAEVSPFEMLEAMGDKLAHLHLSDHCEGRDCLIPGDGCFELDKLAAALDTLGYGGRVILELYSWCFEGERRLAEGAARFDRLWQQAAGCCNLP